MSLWRTTPHQTNYLLLYPAYREYPDYNITFFYPMAGRIVLKPKGHIYIEIPQEFIIRDRTDE